jgi:tRNA pseudouridine38-40 synthase
MSHPKSKHDEHPLKNYKIVLEYDGTPYCGWQVQAKGQSIQGVIQEALKKLTKEKVSVTASGRTDAGVHALGQVAHFKSHTTRPIARFQYALNAMIAPTISVKSMEEVPLEFHAQLDAKNKLYSYLILNHTVPSVFMDRFSWQVPKPLNWDAIHAALEILVGEHDFKSFQSVGTDLKSTVRKIDWVKIEECFKDHPHLYAIQIQANGFLKQMVRNIIGTMVQVGQGRVAPKDIKKILEAKDRRKAGPAAPARGLFLISVQY